LKATSLTLLYQPLVRFSNFLQPYAWTIKYLPIWAFLPVMNSLLEEQTGRMGVEGGKAVRGLM
jgi:hypothetical protein